MVHGILKRKFDNNSQAGPLRGPYVFFGQGHFQLGGAGSIEPGGKIRYQLGPCYPLGHCKVPCKVSSS